MKILITGGDGQLAYDLKRAATREHILYSAFSRNELNIPDYRASKVAIEKFQPDFVINTAAYTQVDRAEADVDNALAVNFHGAKNLALICEGIKCPLIHLSTDYVFDGKSNRAYEEDDLISPVNQYGESKWRGEKAIRDHCEKYIVLRVSAVFGVHGNNFVKTILRLAREKEEVSVVSDQLTCPTPAASIADAILTVCESPEWGVFHYCGSPVVSWYDFAKAIIEKSSEYENLRIKNLKSISTEEYITPAKRPLYSVLHYGKCQKIFGIQQPDWKIGLSDVIEELYST
jgi:dTDP-4-dehydrorhamnose reductase